MSVERHADCISRSNDIVIVIGENDAFDFLEGIRASRDTCDRTGFIACVSDSDVRCFIRVVDNIDVGVAGVFMVLFSALATPLADLSTVSELTTRGMLALGYLGICGSGVAFLTWAAALQGLKATVVAMYLFLASILAALWSWIFLGQAVGWAFFPGAGLVLFGLLLVASASAPQREAVKSAAS